jgi:putative transcriptional regulator
MSKRNVFSELVEGFEALEADRKDKITLRRHAIEEKPPVVVTARELVALRKRLRVSRAVFARYLRTNVRTVEGWEQGRARPNAQASLLIRLVATYPDTAERLSRL